MRKIYALLLSYCCLQTSLAQTGSLTGTLTDTASKKKLSLATVTVFKAKDTALITYRLSNDEGVFKVPNLPLNIQLRAIVSYSGYSSFRKEFMLTDAITTIDFGNIIMQPSTNNLDEVTVVAERPPVMVKQDTIEFNASAFKTLPTALVEDLLKKLPGVQVDKNGDIYVNGRKVSRLLVDGKSFFGDDPKVATRNLPANIIDKVQVVDDKDAIARSEDGDASNIGKVINITLKKSAKKGVFGKLYAGAGTNDRNEMGGIANVYRDTLQLSLLAFSNNINRSGFSLKDVQTVGGFDRSGYSSMMTTSNGNRQGFALNNISFGGTEDGLNTTSGMGFNLNHAPNKKTSFMFQYFYGQSTTNEIETENKQQFLSDTFINARTFTNNNRSNYTNTININYLTKPDTLTDISIRAGYTSDYYKSISQITLTNDNNKVGKLSTMTGSTISYRQQPWYHHDVSVVRRFRKNKNRTLNLAHGFSNRNDSEDATNASFNQFLLPSTFDSVFAQLRTVKRPNTYMNTSLTFANPINKKLTLRIAARHGYVLDNQDAATFNKDASNAFTIVNPLLSNGYERVQNKFSSSAYLAYKVNKLTLTAGGTLMAQHIVNTFNNNPSNTLVQNLTNILPNAMIQWKAFSLRYNMEVVAPYIAFLNPVPNISNPFFTQMGNPNLLPIKRHNINGWGNMQNQKNNTNINFGIWGNVADDDVVNTLKLSDKGVLTQSPINADGTINIGASIGFGKDYKTKQKFIFSYNINVWTNIQRRRLIVNSFNGIERNFSIEPYLKLSFNWNDVVEFTPSISKGIRSATYTNNQIAAININTFSSDNELVIRVPKKFIWESNIVYRYNSSIPNGLPKENILWNAALSFLFLKEDKGQLKLAVFDLLNRNNQVYSYSYSNTKYDGQTNVLQRYLMLTFTYNIRKLGGAKAKVGGKDRLFWF
jgi:Outer membrane protein beta-barrel family